MAAPSVLRFHGSALAIAGLRQEFEKLERSNQGSKATVEDWTFLVHDEPQRDLPERSMSMPWHAWGMAGCLFAEAAEGYYGADPSPFDFGQVGYLGAKDESGNRVPWPLPDIGIVIVGPPVSDPFSEPRRRSQWFRADED